MLRFNVLPRVRGPEIRRRMPHGMGIRLAVGLTATALGSCAENKNVPAVPDVRVPAVDAASFREPVAALDAGIADSGVEAEIMDLTGAPPERIFHLGTHAEALRLNQIAQISFKLPDALKELFGKVKAYGILGPRVDSEGRTPFELFDFVVDPQTGMLATSVKPLPGAFSEGEENLWHFVVEMGEGEDINYGIYGLLVARAVETSDAGADVRRPRDVRRRDDAGAPPVDVPPPPPDISAAAEARVRIRP